MPVIGLGLGISPDGQWLGNGVWDFNWDLALAWRVVLYCGWSKAWSRLWIALKHGLSRVGPGHHLTLEKDQGLGGP